MSMRRAVYGEKETIYLTLGGDIAPIGKSGERLASPSCLTLWGNIVHLLNDSDFSIANLECPLTNRIRGSLKRGPVLHAAAECARGIRAAGFHAVTLANNHIMDMGAGGLEDTLSACATFGLKTVGAGRTLAEACVPLLLEKNGVRVAILAFAEREFSIAGPSTHGAAPTDPISNSEQIASAKQLADVVIVLVHGGNEHYPLPRPGLAKYCRFLIRCGAAAVVCHHSHVAAPIEVYKGGIISYGVGNLLFDGIAAKDEDWHIGYLLHLRISRDGVFAHRVSPFKQLYETQTVRCLDSAEEAAFFSRLDTLASNLTSDELLRCEWHAFCQRRAPRYIAALRAPLEVRGLSKLLGRYSALSRLLMPTSARLFLLAVLRCESHREVVETILSQPDERDKCE